MLAEQEQAAKQMRLEQE
jgi:hypothetical protein